jgi:hypothetical protein
MLLSEMNLFDPWIKTLNLENCSTDKPSLIIFFGLISTSLLVTYFFLVRSSVVGFVSGFFLRFFAPTIIFVPFSFIYYEILFKNVSEFQKLNDCFIRVRNYWREQDSVDGSGLLEFWFINFALFVVTELGVFIATATRNAFHPGEPT